MINSFKKYLQDIKKSEIEELPVNHIANLNYLEEFINQKLIAHDYLGDKCEVFGEHFLYTFYGRPAFKLNDDNAYPVCFVFEKPKQNPQKAFPFDSGAFHHNRMAEFFDMTNVKIEDFDITEKDENENIFKIIENFFNSNEDYYNENAAEDINIPNDIETVRGYLKMISAKEVAGLDDRKSAIELLYDFPFALNNGMLKLVILPKIDFYLNGKVIALEELIENMKNDYKCEISTYDQSTTNPVSSSYVDIRKMVMDYIF